MAVGGVVLVALTALVLYLAPRVLPNLGTAVAETHLTQTVQSADGGSALVDIPAGWAYQRPWGSESEIVLRSPDGHFTVSLTLAPGTPAEVLAPVTADASFSSPAVERLASGLEVAHAETAGTIAAAVGGASASPTAMILARASADDMAKYRPALAALLESVRVSS